MGPRRLPADVLRTGDKCPLRDDVQALAPDDACRHHPQSGPAAEAASPGATPLPTPTQDKEER